MRPEYFDNDGNYHDPQSGDYFEVATGNSAHACSPGPPAWPPGWVTISANESSFSMDCEFCAHFWPERTTWSDDAWARIVVDDDWPNVRFFDLESMRLFNRAVTSFTLDVPTPRASNRPSNQGEDQP